MKRKPASGTIVERKNGYMPRYYVIENGKRKDKYGTLHHTKKEAKAELAALIVSLNDGTYVADSVQTVEHWLREWLELWTPKAGARAKERYQEQFEWYIIPRIGSMALQDLEPADIQRLYRELGENGRKKRAGNQPAGLHPNTIRLVHASLKRAMAKAVALKKLLRNPCADVELASAKAKVRSEATEGTVNVHDCLDQGQLTKLLESFRDNDLYPFVVLAAATGMRRGELLALRWDRVDLDKRVLHVDQTLEVTGQKETRTITVKQPKTASSIRCIDLPATAVAILRDHRAEQRKLAEKVTKLQPRGALVFPIRPWEPLAHQDPGLVSARFSAVARRRGFRVHLHQLRHTHASLLLRAGVPITDVALRLGHANPGVTLKVYSHAIKSDQAHTVAAVDQMLGG